MKWTLVLVALLGVMTYVAIYVAQSQYDRGEQKALVTASVDAPVAQTFAVAAPESVQADPLTVAAEPASTAAQFDGDAWQAGVAAFESGDFETAAVALRAAVSNREDSSYRHFLLGLSLRRIGEVEQAESQLERSLELSPSSVRIATSLARVRLDLDDPEGAREAVDVALGVDIEHADAWHLLGRVELAQGNLEAAEAAFGRAVAKDPAHSWAQNNLGYVRILQERFDAAVQPLVLAVSDGSDEATFYNNLGVALERTGHAELACASFGRAALIGHGPAESSYDRVAEILVESGRPALTMDEIEGLDGKQFALSVEEILAAETLITTVQLQPEFEVDPTAAEEFHDERSPR